MPNYTRQFNQGDPHRSALPPPDNGRESSTDAPLGAAERAEYDDEVWYAGTRPVDECNRLLQEQSMAQ